LSQRKVLRQPQGKCSAAVLHFFSPQTDTSVHCETMDTELVNRAVCMLTSQVTLVLIAPIHGGMARLSGTGWLSQIHAPDCSVMCLSL